MRRRSAAISAVAAYRAWQRLRDYGFTHVASGSFFSCGRKTVIQLPIRLSGESEIALGDEVFIGSGSWLQVLRDHSSGDFRPVITIGDGTSIAGSCVVSAAESVVIGSKVLLARNVYVADHSHAFADPRRAILDQGIQNVQPVEIGDGAWLGQNVFVGPGVRIGRGAVVGANSVVLSDVPDYSIAVGAPARVIRIFSSVVEDAP